jgi:hypothetical protein
VLIVIKSGSLNFLEPSVPVQACNGIALPFIYSLLYGTLKEDLKDINIKARNNEGSVKLLARLTGIYEHKLEDSIHNNK